MEPIRYLILKLIYNLFFVILGDKLHNAMESQFLTAIQQNDAEVLKRCLRIYASVERIPDAERLLRSEIIAPYLEVAKNSFSEN